MSAHIARLAVFVLGLIVGAGALALWRGEARRTIAAVAPDAGSDAVRPAPPAHELPAARGPERTERSDPPHQPREEAALPLLSPALLAYADDGLREGWKSVRSDELPSAIRDEGMQTFEEAVLGLPRALGRQLAERETQREQALEDARTGGVFAMLEHLDAGGVGPMLEQVRERDVFEAWFARDTKESFADGSARIALEEPVEDGVTLSFSAGVFALEDFLRKWSHPDALARDLTVAGAGMDHTLLVGGDLSCYSRLRNLRLRDCTIYSPRGGLLDLRREAASVTLERVRLCGFDTGAGGSSAINTRALAIHFVDCELLGGYGGRPTSGRIFDVRTDALLARFDRCTLASLRVAVRSMRPGATVVFSNCTLRDIFDDALVDAEQHPGVQFDACSFERAPASDEVRLLDDLHLRKDLNEWFPDWGQELKR